MGEVRVGKSEVSLSKVVFDLGVEVSEIGTEMTGMLVVAG
jgi:hypothetical protein